MAPPSSVTTRQCSSELDTALAAPSVGDALIINCVPDDKMSRMANPEGVIYRAGSLTLSLGSMQRAEYQTLKGLFPWRVTPLHKFSESVQLNQ